ncbi:MAG: outer membrane protein assembly factor BamE [Oleiphilaceae bacterium]|nr:outer membrane protein assembly factor BamE [Oleiphilaceae bacterium]
MAHWFVLLLIGLPLSSAGVQVFRCESSDGVVFSDQECGPDAEKITVEESSPGGDLGADLPAPRDKETKSDDRDNDAEEGGACRYISSTKLRTLLIRNQVVPGMTREQVTKAFGRPVETYPVPQETWVYETDYYGKLYELTYVYFRDGCVETVEYRKP